jgi:hypothetical protein
MGSKTTSAAIVSRLPPSLVIAATVLLVIAVVAGLLTLALSVIAIESSLVSETSTMFVFSISPSL